MASDSNLPSASDKPSLLEWLETFLPFQFPRIPLVRAAANLDRAAAMIVLAGGENVVARIRSSTSRIDARTAAERTLIEYGQSKISQGPPTLADRALEHAVGNAIRYQENREEVLRIAVDHISSTPPREDASEMIDEDWLDAFKRYAETKSNSEVQQLWGRILSAEIRKPGSTSLRTLDFLSTTSSADANRVADAFACVIDGRIIPSFVQEAKKLSFADLLFLQEVGVLGGSVGSLGTIWEKTTAARSGANYPYSLVVVYFDKAALIETDVENYMLQIPAGILTTVGCELFGITDSVRRDYEFFMNFAKSLGKPPIKRISIVDIQSRVDGQVTLAIDSNVEVFSA